LIVDTNQREDAQSGRGIGYGRRTKKKRKKKKKKKKNPISRKTYSTERCDPPIALPGFLLSLARLLLVGKKDAGCRLKHSENRDKGTTFLGRSRPSLEIPRSIFGTRRGREIRGTYLTGGER